MDNRCQVFSRFLYMASLCVSDIQTLISGEEHRLLGLVTGMLNHQ